VNPASGDAEITMLDSVKFSDLEAAFKNHPDYRITAKLVRLSEGKKSETTRPWLGVYKPLLLIFIYLIVVCSLVEVTKGPFGIQQWMRHFMAGYFLIFSFFKFLDLKGFSRLFTKFDIPSRFIPGYSIVYPFLETGLGLLLLMDAYPLSTYLLIATLMFLKILRIFIVLMNDQKIQSACLGTVFNLPLGAETMATDIQIFIMAACLIVA
jgi:hypothetical protein